MQDHETYIAAVRAAVAGKPVERRGKGDTGPWSTVASLDWWLWNPANVDYRPAPEPVTRPMTTRELLTSGARLVRFPCGVEVLAIIGFLDGSQSLRLATGPIFSVQSLIDEPAEWSDDGAAWHPFTIEKETAA